MLREQEINRNPNLNPNPNSNPNPNPKVRVLREPEVKAILRASALALKRQFESRCSSVVSTKMSVKTPVSAARFEP